MRILVMGAGSMGSVVGGFMGKADHDVSLVGRETHMETIRKHGLRISGIWGEHSVCSLDTYTDVMQLAHHDFDLIIISVKSYDTTKAVEIVRPLVGDHTLVCSYQNGLGNAEIIAETVGWEHTLDVRAIYGVWIPEPGHAEVTVIANPTAIGSYHDAVHEERVKAIVAAMDEAGIPTVYSDKIATVLWAKVAYNCALNPLSALLDVPYGALLETEESRQTMRYIIMELYKVAEAMEVCLEPQNAEDYVKLLFEGLIPPTAAHYASMREDFRRRRRTEIDALNGAICRYGLQVGIPCPTNLLLTRLIRAREHALGIERNS